MWVDEYISKHLLETHLNPDIELASRKGTTINSTLDWIMDSVTAKRLDILAKNNFDSTSFHDNILPGCDLYRSEDVTFCITKKE
ncbi:MAG: hypothetical protein PF503_12600 [Desulfobacula sp.]|jgi:hypothetical protein|nr:hypothetical protein [Desulfobacula sp.]